MTALEELPDKDKDLIFPIFPMKGWSSSKKLNNTLNRITKAIDDRPWGADIDHSFLDGKKDPISEEYPREVFYQIEELLDSTDAYENWYQYLKSIDSAIPVLQLHTLSSLTEQYKKLNSLNRGVIVRFNFNNVSTEQSIKIIDLLSQENPYNIFIIFDYGSITKKFLDTSSGIAGVVNYVHKKIPNALISTSSTSFPSSFANQMYGENPIYERQLHQKVSTLTQATLVYSDRGSARAERNGGGGGIPAPRIDYPLAHDWRFIRREFNERRKPAENEKERLYTEIAQEMMKQDYWEHDLNLWGTQVIELTSIGDDYGINSPARSTAVRINIHLYKQLHYDTPLEELDTDEDWED